MASRRRGQRPRPARRRRPAASTASRLRCRASRPAVMARARHGVDGVPCAAPATDRHRPVPDDATCSIASSACWRQRLPGQRARHPRLRRRRRRARRPRSARPMHSHSGRPPAPCSRTCPATSSSSCRRTELAGSWPRSSASRSASWCACSRCPSRSGRGRRCSCTSRAPVHRRAPRARRRRRRPRLRRRPADVRVVRRRQLAGPHRGERAPPERRPPGRPRRPRAVDRRAVDVVVRPAAGGLVAELGEERPARSVRRASAATRRPPTAPPSRPSGRSATSAASPRLLAGADELATSPRPRRRRPGGRVALPRVPAGIAGGAVRAAAAARPPRPGGARRAAVHVPPRRRRVYLYDIGVRVPARSSSTSTRRRPL